MTELTYRESIRIEASPDAVYDMVADRGREFAFIVAGKLVHWDYNLVKVEQGTELTESWEFLPAGIAYFHETYGALAEVEIAKRITAAHTGIPATLAAIKRIAESD